MELRPDRYGMVIWFLPSHSPAVAVFGVWNPTEHVVHVVASVHTPQPVPHAAIRDNITWLCHVCTDKRYKYRIRKKT